MMGAGVIGAGVTFAMGAMGAMGSVDAIGAMGAMGSDDWAE